MSIIACCLLLPSVTAAAPAPRLIEPADIIRVSPTLRVQNGFWLRTEDLYVYPDGTVQTGSDSAIYVAGLTFVEAAKRLQTYLSEFYRCPLEDVSVAIELSVARKQEVWVIIHVVTQDVTHRIPIDEARDMLGSARKISDCRAWIERPTNTGYQFLDVTGQPTTDYVLQAGDRVHVSKASSNTWGTRCIRTGWSPAMLLPDSVIWGIRVLLNPWW